MALKLKKALQQEEDTDSALPTPSRVTQATHGWMCGAKGARSAPVHGVRAEGSEGTRIAAATSVVGFVWPRPDDGTFQSILSSSHIHVLENGSLTITVTQKSDAGYYMCETSNDVGEPLRYSVRLAVHFSLPLPSWTPDLDLDLKIAKSNLHILCK
ncbi:down syndrome cell adhesion molecule [Caerostris extrusa]|uniref:Down syndrome cell adhesion molecule n=1 Tax=Caerostris extrusa TaxID=172846 RepID=A0AAV4X2I8_CAEEX|nr:down syndrome cell adhesion molecule [Caerostris extrusa]